jgi:xanthine dehydrogenase accessory factor
MPVTAPALSAFLDAHAQVAKVEVTEAKGSTPREAGTWMLVAPTAIFGTIGGGQLEFMAIDEARKMLRPSPRGAGPDEHSLLSIPLGPEIGQCCGGRVELSIRRVNDADRTTLVEALAAADARLPAVLVFGGGHVGRALAQALALLPVRARVVETRADAVDGFPPEVETRLTPMPEEQVRAAQPGTAFVVLTHDHALDFLIVAEALRRGDAAYVGMIGSQTKKATLRSWFLKTAGGSDAEFSRLVSPIGGAAVRDKRPAVIAALAAAEIMTALAQS